MTERFLPHTPGDGPPVPRMLPPWPWIQKPNLGEKKSENPSPVSNPVDEIEEMTQRKREEFSTKGYPPGQIEKALLWAASWASALPGVKAASDISPEVGKQVYKESYRQALALSNKWIEGVSEFLAS